MLLNLLAQTRNTGSAPTTGTSTSNVGLGSFTPPTTAYSTGSDTAGGAISNFELVISNIIGFLTFLGAFFFVLFFIIGALQWISSGGDKGKVEKARNQMMQGAIGMIIIIAAYAVLGLVGGIIGFDLLNPGAALENLIPN